MGKPQEERPESGAEQPGITGWSGTLGGATLAGKSRWWRLLRTFLIVSGPGLIVMMADNDVGAVNTYTQAGALYGYGLLWTLLLLIPVLGVNQEMAARLGAITGVGHARLIFARFGTFWGAFSFFDLFILNFLTLLTEFIGVVQAASYFGISRYVAVPAFFIFLTTMVVTGSYRIWERWMMALVAAMFIFLPLAFLAPHPARALARGLFIPQTPGGLTSSALLLIIAIVGTTVAPWQLFFQQSNVVDKRIGPAHLRYEQTETWIGSVLTSLFAGFMMLIGVALHNAGIGWVNAEVAAHVLAHLFGARAGAGFAVGLLVAALLGAMATTMSSAWALGDVLRIHHSLHRKVREAPIFYAAVLGQFGLAALLVLTPRLPVNLIITGVQALAGILLPSATVFLVLLCNDPEVLGPWTNSRSVNAAALLIVGALLGLSLILTATTLFPHIDGLRISEAVFGVLGLATVLGGAVWARLPSAPPVDRTLRAHWRMASIGRLRSPSASALRTGALVTLRVYLLLAVLAVGFKIWQLA
ncbi:MAG TPA: NRAMP family divalent metal transporter, partial [Acidiferrobacteraceae bacterium]|nr:NRAMP family divalent metal transporter [Acidiferrobacteraceae bacterium]